MRFVEHPTKHIDYSARTHGEQSIKLPAETEQKLQLVYDHAQRLVLLCLNSLNVMLYINYSQGLLFQSKKQNKNIIWPIFFCFKLKQTVLIINYHSIDVRLAGWLITLIQLTKCKQFACRCYTPESFFSSDLAML